MTVESLNVTSGDARGASVAVDDELVLGRSCAHLPGLWADTEISRVHARVWRDYDGELMIEDLGSRNGTFLNGSRIHGPSLLRPGDWLRVGQTTMEVANGSGVGGLVTRDGAPRYDALVTDDAEATRATPGQVGRVSRGSAGHIRPWPLAAILAALLTGAALGAAVAASSRQAAKTSTVVVTRSVERPAPRPRLVAPSQRLALPPPVPVAAAIATANPAATYPAGARDVFVRAFCGRGATATKAVCGCTYVELTRREPYALLLSQVSRSHRAVAPPIASAARACGAGA